MSIELDNAEKAMVAYAKAKRIAFRSGLNPNYALFYNEIVNEMDKDPRGKYWAPYSAFRTLQAQDKLYQKGRMGLAGEKIVTNAKAGDSPHNWGCATDWVEFLPNKQGPELWEHSDWDFYGSICKKVGTKWGGEFIKFPDKPHNELRITCSWTMIGDFYRAHGAAGVAQFIAEHIG